MPENQPPNLSAIPLPIGPNLEFICAAGALDVRSFSVKESLATLFSVELVALSPDPNLSFANVVGAEARFAVAAGGVRAWSGVIAHAEQTGVEEDGLSTYAFKLVPKLWLLSQRRNYRMFQQLSEIDIVQQFLREWEIEHRLELRETYKARRYRVQYGESDLDFVCRLLEEAGVTFSFEMTAQGSQLVLDDRPHARDARPLPVPYTNQAIMGMALEHVTELTVTQDVRPGRYTQRDHDYRRAPSFPLLASASLPTDALEARLERFHYVPGAFLFRSEQGDPSPSADDRGRQRTDLEEAQRRVGQRLEAQRGSARRIHFRTTAHDLVPGTVFGIAGHPRLEVSEPNQFLILSSRFEGTATGEWTQRCEAQPTSLAFRPELKTPRPRTQGVESATVVGPSGEEIHTDEFGRVRVQFHWDREGSWDERSSCWIHVSQPWGGAGYGAVNLPRIGQEVLVDFLGGDPDRPVIVGRVFTNLQRVPYQLPQRKTQSGWRSYSSPATGGYNEIQFEDAAGSELMNVRAEKDRATRVNNDCTTSIGRDRTAEIGRDDKTTVERNQSVTVSKGDRELTVAEGRLTETVNKSITRESVTGDQMFQTHGTFLSLAKRNVLHSDEYLELHVGPLGGGSSIVMTPSCIVLQAPRVFINPGQEATELARNGGAIPSGEEERQVRAEQEAIQEAARTEAEFQRMTALGQAGAAVEGRLAHEQRAQEVRQRRLEARQRRGGSGQGGAP